jgi:hypothetical protein
VEEGSFREDLYYRIAVVMIQTPPLRERRDDISRLVRHFLDKFSSAHRKRIRGFAPRAMEVLLSYPWPGNVRQLENCIEQAVVLCEDDTIGVEALSLSENSTAREGESFIRIRSGLPLRDVEQEYILRTLQETGGNRTRAARARHQPRCLQYKLKAYAEGGSTRHSTDRAVEPQHLLGVYHDETTPGRGRVLLTLPFAASPASAVSETYVIGTRTSKSRSGTKRTSTRLVRATGRPHLAATGRRAAAAGKTVAVRRRLVQAYSKTVRARS